MDKILNDKATCSAFVIKKIIETYQNTCGEIAKELYNKVSKIDISNPFAQIPLSFLDELIEWVEKELGPANVKMIGHILGETAFETLKKEKQLPEKATPKEIIEKLMLVLQSIIQDPFRRNIKVVEVQNNFARVRRTQAFHPTVQIGIIESFIRKAGVSLPRTRLIRNYENGPEYDEYEITWY